MKKLAFLLLIIVTSTFVACNKENWWIPNTTVHGKVTDVCTGQPLANVELKMYRGFLSPNHTSQNTVFRTVYTDNDGYYEIKFSQGNHYEYWLEITSISNYTFNQYGYTGNHRVVENKHDVEFNFPLVKAVNNCYASIHIKNTTPVDTTDYIFLKVTEPNNPGIEFSYYPYNEIDYRLRGQNIDSTATINVYGCSPLLVKLDYTVTKNHIATNHTDTITCVANTTTPYSLNY